ncbi:MAG: aminotransferase class III-fold pyridoxal phosphate-dependent enzyme, partial [bacterium]|nr:aminotransferase class III-fold pyridoxal phosphate-dependent enzyme [bacterium]
RTEHCENLKKYMPKKLNRFFLTNTGAETVEGALKFARLVTKRQQIISLTRGYHGRTLGALSATHAAKHRDGYGDLLPHFVFTDFDDLKELEKTISGKTAAVILEVLQGEGGIHLASKEFVKGVRKLCDKHGALMIVDEIQTGMGRTGKMWAFEHFAVVPDMVCISKGVGNGIPLGVLAVTEEISSKIHRGSHGATFAGGPLTAVAGIATLDYFQKHQILKRVRENGGYFLKKLKALKSPRIQEVRGLGLILGIELKEKAADFIKTLQKKGVLVLPAGENIIRVLPPYIITKEQIDKCIAMLKNVLK